MSLLIKALDKAQEAKAQEAKLQQDKSLETKAKETNVQQVVNQEKKDENKKNQEIKTQPKEKISAAVKRQPQALPDVTNYADANTMDHASAEKNSVANVLEMELSPVPPLNANPPEIAASKIQRHSAPSMANNPTKIQQPVPADHSATTKNLASLQNSTVNISATHAANVFAAKRIESNQQNAILAIVAALGLCLLLAAGGYYYLFMDDQPDFVIAKRPVIAPVGAVKPVANMQLTNTPAVISQQEKPAEVVVVQADVKRQSLAIKQPKNKQASEALQVDTPPSSAKSSKPSVFNDQDSTEEDASSNNQVTSNQELALDDMDNDVRVESARKSQPVRSDAKNLSNAIASRSAFIQLSKNQPQSGVNPVLMEAYNAYNAGNDALASKLYRQVLQRDMRSVDALLGLGAIAQRQGRLADANGWYTKVLEVEPRNALASTAILQNQPQNDVTNNESRIKNMLAKYPDDANLHAALGNFYADLNQWPAAQQAYFDAYRLNASADNALNLAVSLDQLGKPKLALPYYQSALQLAQIGNSNIDKVALEARIAAIR